MIHFPRAFAERMRRSENWRVAMAAVVAGVLIGVSTLIPERTAQAADASPQNLDVAPHETSRFVRIGLNKSVVLRLPVDARDVLVGNPEVVDAVVRTKRTTYLFARSVGQTNIFIFDDDGEQILSLDVEVAQDTTALRNLLRRLNPNTRIEVETIGDNVILSGTARSSSEAHQAKQIATRFTGDENKVMSTVKIAAREQVMLRVRVIEIQRNVLKQLGINMGGLVSSGANEFAYGIVNPFSLGTGAVSSVFRASLGLGNGVPDFEGTLRLMERDGILRTLAEPNLTAISGESAKFLAGGEFPVPVASQDGQVTIQFKPFGVGLGFTPVVLSEGRISIQVSTEVSELSAAQGVNVGTGTQAELAVPSLQVRRAETTVEMPSGGSLVMAGLIQENMKQEINGLPGLMHVPVLGALFRSRDFQRNETELVVMVTPFVVDSVSEHQLAAPDQGFTTPSDGQTILFGQLNRVYGQGSDKSGRIYHGQVGFIVE